MVSGEPCVLNPDKITPEEATARQLTAICTLYAPPDSLDVVRWSEYARELDRIIDDLDKITPEETKARQLTAIRTLYAPPDSLDVVRWSEYARELDWIIDDLLGRSNPYFAN